MEQGSSSKADCPLSQAAVLVFADRKCPNCHLGVETHKTIRTPLVFSCVSLSPLVFASICSVVAVLAAPIFSSFPFFVTS